MINLAFLLALHTVDGLGPKRLKKVLDFFKDPKIAWDAPISEFKSLGIPDNTLQNLSQKRHSLDPEKYLDEILNKGIKILTIYDDDYPKILKQIYDPPNILFYKGKIPQGQSIGVVGTRKITGYGKLVTEKFVKELVAANLIIVSGLARGVDTIAHKVTIEEGGKTIAVLGGGLNTIFPPENEKLARNIENFGAVVSEYPPDYPHLAGNFPSRNRIIAGLSQAVLVTEAAENSGSLITARLAIEEGRDVFAIPGPITSSLAKGPADLIKEGAKLVFTPEEILEDLGLKKRVKPTPQTLIDLTNIEKNILTILENETKHVDELVRELNSTSSEISASLIKMEIKGLILNLGGGNYSVR